MYFVSVCNCTSHYILKITYFIPIYSILTRVNINAAWQMSFDYDYTYITDVYDFSLHKYLFKCV